jgi:hypothetical protein
MREVAALATVLAIAMPATTQAVAAPVRDCHYASVGATSWTFGIQIVRTRNVGCAAGKRVLRHVGNWLNARYYRDLGASRHRAKTDGYRCTVRLIGDSAWEIRCQRKTRVVVGFTAN